MSSVSHWVRDVELTEEQVEALRRANPIFNRQRGGQERRMQSARAVRLEAQEQGRAAARLRDPLHHAGCMLYWADGSKKRNTVHLVNSDADMLRFFVRFLRECYAVPPDRFRFSVNCYLNNGLTIEEIERWWLDKLELPASAARTHIVNRPPSSSKQLKRNLPYGTARVSVYSTHIVQSIYGAIQEYAGIERPEWLD